MDLEAQKKKKNRILNSLTSINSDSKELFLDIENKFFELFIIDDSSPTKVETLRTLDSDKIQEVVNRNNPINNFFTLEQNFKKIKGDLKRNNGSKVSIHVIEYKKKFNDLYSNFRKATNFNNTPINKDEKNEIKKYKSEPHFPIILEKQKKYEDIGKTIKDLLWVTKGKRFLSRQSRGGYRKTQKSRKRKNNRRRTSRKRTKKKMKGKLRLNQSKKRV